MSSLSAIVLCVEDCCLLSVPVGSGRLFLGDNDQGLASIVYDLLSSVADVVAVALLALST